MGYTIREKSFAIAKGLDKEQAKISRAFFNARLDTTISYNDLAAHYNQLIKEFGHFEWRLAETINHSKYKRVGRIKKRVKNIVLSGNAIFVTLTFTDSVLKATSDETRKKYIKRYLKENSLIYVANKDFGATNGREHYHAIVSSPTKLNLSHWNQYGAINVKRIRSSEKDLTKVSKYVAKLTNHAIKETALNQRLIYSRKSCYNLGGPDTLQFETCKSKS